LTPIICSGFRSSFDRGCLSLWFNFRRSVSTVTFYVPFTSEYVSSSIASRLSQLRLLFKASTKTGFDYYQHVTLPSWEYHHNIIDSFLEFVAVNHLKPCCPKGRHQLWPSLSVAATKHAEFKVTACREVESKLNVEVSVCIISFVIFQLLLTTLLNRLVFHCFQHDEPPSAALPRPMWHSRSYYPLDNAWRQSNSALATKPGPRSSWIQCVPPNVGIYGPTF
jgi:hypothetical protein